MIGRWLIGLGIVCFILAGVSFFVMAAGMGYDRGVVEGYGCGRHDAMQTKNSDPAEYDLQPCVDIRKLWLRSEEWPHK
jgi:hypothetical protein